MYREYFIAAREYLQQQGMNPVFWQKGAVTAADIDLIDQRTDHPMPSEIRRFYIEMGDAFLFTPNDAPDSPLNGWTANHLDDYAIWNKGFHTAIEEDAYEEIASIRPRVDPRLLREEAERRKRWIPFYGFNGAGDVLCLDSEGRVKFYEALYWRSCPDTWSFVLADSFDDFVARWSKYSFVDPGCLWTSFCIGRTGAFDWAPSHFPHGVDRSVLQHGHEKQA